MFGSPSSAALALAVLAIGCLHWSVAGDRRLPVREQLKSWADAQVVDTTFADTVQYRLPNNTRPLAYDIQLTTNVHRADFAISGRVAITIEVLEAATRTITLHHRQLSIGVAQLRLGEEANGQLIAVRPTEYNEPNELLTVSVADGQPDLQLGQRYVLSIEFAGTLREDLRGFYRSSYVADDGSVRYLAGTHFEPTNARHGFPCFDEPGLMATYKLTITHGAGYFAVSNMPVLSSIASADNLTRTTAFERTPPMPTYLNAFVVSDFASAANTNPANNFVQHIFARPNAIAAAEFGLETGRRVLDAFERRLGVNYTLPKMDQIAVPGFRGAMENWGLIIYGEPYLLYSEAVDTFTNKLDVAVTVAHEFAHQWFGNLVTCKWWTYNWLNEGFANLYEYHAIDWIFPEWKILDTMVFDNTQSVMVQDSTPATRPMSRYVESPAAISSNFDSIGYGKSGAVLNMFLHAFTEPKFTAGLKVYLDRHANSVATEAELFAALQETVIGNEAVSQDFTISNIMSSWTQQAGFPLLIVHRNYSNGEVHLSQQRYFSDPDAREIEPARWWIPYNWATASVARFNETAAETWMAPNALSNVLRLADLRPEDWLLLNKRQTGYYRVQYDVENYARLAAALKTDVNAVHVASRSQVVDDLFDLARAERLTYDTVFDVIGYLEKEVEYVPWASALRGLALVNRLHSGSGSFEKYKFYIVKLLTALYTEVGLTAQPGEHFYRQHARRLAIQWSCQYGCPHCRNDTNNALQTALNDRSQQLHPDYSDVILCAGARNASLSQFTQLLQMVQRHAALPRVRSQLIATVACVSQPALLQIVLDRTLNSTETWLTQPERFQLFSAVARNRDGVALALDLLTSRLTEAVEQLGLANVNGAVEQLAQHVNNAELVAKFTGLVTEGKLILSEEAIVRASQVLANNDRWIRRNQKTIDDWIEKNGATSTVVSGVLLMVAALVVQMLY